MELKYINPKEIKDIVKGKKIICFGVGKNDICIDLGRKR